MNNNFQYNRRELLVIYMAWWLFWGLAQIIVLHMAGLSLTLSAFDGLVSTGLLSLISFSTITMYRFFQPGRSNSLYRLLNWVVFTIVYCITLKWILLHALPSNPGYQAFLGRTMPVRFVFSLLITLFINIVTWLLNYVGEQKEKEKKQSEIETMMREAELAKLRQQLQPHFLFNSLNSINALVNTKPQEARKMVQQLSDFLRGTLKKDDQQFTTLKDELAHLQLYLDIEKVRFGHRLNIDIKAAPESMGCTLPSLILQPVVENAIKFGLYDTVGEITISIAAYKTPEGLKLEVRNPFDPQTGHSVKGTGFGLSSVQRRLYLVYARQDLLLTEKNDSLFKTILKIPNQNA